MSDQDVDLERRRFLTISTSVVGGVGMAAASVAGIMYWTKSERALALGAPTVVSISRLKPGEQMVTLWRSQPIWLLKRTPEMLKELVRLNSHVKDSMSDESELQPSYAKNQYRSIREEIFIVIGICTHLGCSPRHKKAKELGADWGGGYLCACHGSKFDYAGRVFNGAPAPSNLKVPKHHFHPDNPNMVIIGVDPKDEGAKS